MVNTRVDFQQRDLNINGTLVRLQIFDTGVFLIP